MKLHSTLTACPVSDVRSISSRRRCSATAVSKSGWSPRPVRIAWTPVGRYDRRAEPEIYSDDRSFDCPIEVGELPHCQALGQLFPARQPRGLRHSPRAILAVVIVAGVSSRSQVWRIQRGFRAFGMTTSTMSL